MSHVLLFWESRSLKTLLAKNIIAHRSRNRLTSNIYALTLGCIIFLIVSANLQVESVTQLTSFGGADIVISIPVDSDGTSVNGPLLTASMVDPILEKHATLLKDFAYVTKPLKEELPGEDVATLIQKKSEKNS